MRIKMGFTGLSIPEVIERSRRIITMMTGNPNFATPLPTLADFTTAVDALEVAYNNAADGGKALKDIMRLRLTGVMDIVRKEAAYVQDESGGGEEIILSSGFDVVRRGGPVPIGQVLKLRTEGGKSAGSIRAIWDKVPGAGAYLVELSSTGSAGVYSLYRVVLGTRITITGLTPGELYWIRSTAVGRYEYGLPSDPSPHNASVTYGAPPQP